MSKLKIGDNLYRYTGVSIMEYKVTAIVKREVGTLYEVECLSCRDHEACVLLLVASKSNFGFRFVDMVGDNNQEYWHTDNDPYQRYELTKDLAVTRRNEKFIETLKEYNLKSQASIESNLKKIKEAEAIIEALQPAKPKEKDTTVT